MPALWLYLRFESLQLDLLYQTHVAAPPAATTTTTTARTTGVTTQPIKKKTTKHAAAEAQAETPQAICLIDNQKLQVKQLNQAARLFGILPGHTIPMACALNPQVQLLPYQSELEQRQLQQIAALLYLHCADIALDPPAALWLRVDPMLELYQGLAPLLLKLREQLPQLNIQLGAGVSAAAALLVACHQPQVLPFLAELSPATVPVAAFAASTQPRAVPIALQQLAKQLQQQKPDQCLLADSRLPSEILEQLSALGIVRLAQLQALPTAELSRRFPKTLQLYLAELQGQQPASLVFYQPPEQFSEKLELLYHCEYVAQLQGPLTLLLKKLEHYLLQRDQHCYQLQLVLELQHQAPLQLDIQSAQGEYQHQRWLSLCQLRLEQLKLPAPVQLLELRATQCCLKSAVALALFDRSQGALTPAQLQSILIAKLGPQSLRQLSCQQEHRPLRANQCQPLQLLPSGPNSISTTEKQHHKTPATGLVSAAPRAGQPAEPLALTDSSDTSPQALPLSPGSMMRPAFLFAKPQPLHSPLTLQPGIERIVTGWWDGQMMERDYQIGRNAQGQWCWVFKDRSGWYLQGYFA
jgi:protein ImuB